MGFAKDMTRICNFFKSERGNVESALTLIPLLFLFLLGMQMATIAHQRNILSAKVQDDASVRAISGQFRSSDEFLHIESSGDGQNLDLLITRGEAGLLNRLPLFLSGKSSKSSIEVQGFAVIENRR